MRVYKLSKTQVLPITLEKAWTFFGDPSNLADITPSYMGFKVLTELPVFPDKLMYPGMIINYKLSPVLNIPMRWTTEITHVEDHKYFVDEQRSGPYSMWHHEHHFREVPGGVEMIDILHYAIPLGFLGTIAHSIFVKRKIEHIFEHRYFTLAKLFAGKAPEPTSDNLHIAGSTRVQSI